MNLEIEGKLVKVLDVQTGEGRNGTWQKQEFVIETEDQYPKQICLQVWGDKVDAIKQFSIGDKIKTGIDIESREYNGRYYTNIKAWKVEKIGDNNFAASKNTPLPNENDIPPMPQDNEDDLPF